jgi:hypothetical protein
MKHHRKFTDIAMSKLPFDLVPQLFDYVRGYGMYYSDGKPIYIGDYVLFQSSKYRIMNTHNSIFVVGNQRENLHRFTYLPIKEIVKIDPPVHPDVSGKFLWYHKYVYPGTKRQIRKSDRVKYRGKVYYVFCGLGKESEENPTVCIINNKRYILNNRVECESENVSVSDISYFPKKKLISRTPF